MHHFAGFFVTQLGECLNVGCAVVDTSSLCQHGRERFVYNILRDRSHSIARRIDTNTIIQDMTLAILFSAPSVSNGVLEFVYQNDISLSVVCA